MDARQLVKDATAVGAVASAGGLFVVRACRADKALPRAGRNALNGAALAAPLAGVWGFAVAKDSHYKWEREEALEMTAYWGGVAALAAGALCGLASLARDAFRA